MYGELRSSVPNRGETAITILTIRKHQRFAVRHDVSLGSAAQRPRRCLMVEVSLDGCRLAAPGSENFVTGQPVVLEIEGFGRMKAQVRWTRDQLVGLKFDAPLHHAELDDLIQTCRADAAEQLRRA